MINLEQLRNLMGNSDAMVSRFLAIFKAEIPNQLDALQNQLEEKNWNALSLTAHAVKSQVKYLGLVNEAEMAYEIEKKAEKLDDLDQIPNLLQDLTLSLQNILYEIEDL